MHNGTLISLLNWKTFRKVNYKTNISLLPTKSKLKTYSGETVSPKSQSEIEFSDKDNKIRATLLFTDEQSPNAPGRDILEKLQLMEYSDETLSIF